MGLWRVSHQEIHLWLGMVALLASVLDKAVQVHVYHAVVHDNLRQRSLYEPGAPGAGGCGAPAAARGARISAWKLFTVNFNDYNLGLNLTVALVLNYLVALPGLGGWYVDWLAVFLLFYAVFYPVVVVVRLREIIKGRAFYETDDRLFGG